MNNLLNFLCKNSNCHNQRNTNCRNNSFLFHENHAFYNKTVVEFIFQSSLSKSTPRVTIIIRTTVYRG